MAFAASSLPSPGMSYLNDIGHSPTSQKKVSFDTAISEESDGSIDDTVSGFVESMLETMIASFQITSDRIITRMDRMNSRINELDRNVDELMRDTGVEHAQHTIVTLKGMYRYVGPEAVPEIKIKTAE